MQTPGWLCAAGMLAAACLGAVASARLHADPVQSNAQVEPLAPDGQRGLGAETPLQELKKLLRSPKGEDAAFLAHLTGLEGEIRVSLAILRAHYRERGLFDLLGPRKEENLNALHEEYRAARRDAMGRLARADDAARLFASLLCDTRFNVRCDLLEDFELNAREVRCGIAVLRATNDGWVSLTADETRAIAARVDLAASLLRALRSDLTALRPVGDAARTTADPDRLRELAEIPKLPEVGARAPALARVRKQLTELEDRMKSALFTTRLEPKVRTLLAWRDKQLDLARVPRQDALAFLPDSKEGRDAPREIQSMDKDDRMRAARTRALEGLTFDPLDEDLAWAAGHASDFMWGVRESRPWYDRYLALRGIRSHEDQGRIGRELDAREREALYAVQQATGLPPR